MGVAATVLGGKDPALTAATVLGDALASRFPGQRIAVRHERDDDREFCAALFALTRADELAVIPWPAETKAAFCRSQFEAQHAHYRRHYADSDLMVVFSDDLRIGRVYVHATPEETRLMEISLLPEWRNRGIGGCLSAAVVAHAHRRGVVAGLHVEPFNPARRLYERQGFRQVEERGIYLYMRCPPPASVAAAGHLIS